ncbi:O-linked N-acetylglucosamine transferase, SPINDLY family protein [Undibacterium terreum]|uniref:protein O-GlcNAc transferase n=1 Tax=Undibacterium terreum TaxID=1224302 RepID=A0A916V111_9BURK|nr:acetylglucosamine transferase [Undibacterium terreum]GGC99894.1 O-linked acetylglucosamine transferase [Undibacterium terreum]
MSNSEQTNYDELLALALQGKLELLKVIPMAEQLIRTQQQAKAIDLYRAWLKHPERALEHAAYFNLGVLLGEVGSSSEAVAAFRQAAHLKPDFFQAQYNVGVHLERQGHFQETIKQWRASLAEPALKDAQNNGIHIMLLNGMGRLLDKFKEYDEAEDVLRRSLELNQEQPAALYHWIHLRQKQCKWPSLRKLPGISVENMWQAASPLALLGLTDDPARLLETARNYVSKNVIDVPRMMPFGRLYPEHKKLKIGFLSGDFCLHALSLLTVRFFELLDRNKYEVIGFGWSNRDGTPFQHRVFSSFDKYYDIAGTSDEKAAELIQKQEIDILFDLQGLTAGTRPNIVARGPAPIQIAYLGYPGTSALPYVDYVIGDEYIYPPELAQHFTEKPLYMPDCYQVSDDQREYSSEKKKAHYGLPEDKFVFCAFNNNYKIIPEVFESWMRILRRVPDSVLWLLKDNQWSEQNMRNAAQAHGIDPDRLFFAGRVSPTDYLSRFCSADLFLDTFPYNAGTTANDAVWVGLPLVTLSGRSYTSRMAGSILRSVGLESLIADTHAEYEDKAVAFALSPQQQAQSSDILKAAKQNSAALNTHKFVADFDAVITRLLAELKQTA